MVYKITSYEIKYLIVSVPRNNSPHSYNQHFFEFKINVHIGQEFWHSICVGMQYLLTGIVVAPVCCVPSAAH